MSLRTDIRQVALASSALPTLLGVGSGDWTKSLLPYPGATLPPLPPRPWAYLELMTSSQLDRFIYLQTFRWTVGDDPIYQYHRIDRLMAEFKRLYPDTSGDLYVDYGSLTFHQELAFESEDAADDDLKQVKRWLDFAIWRA